MQILISVIPKYLLIFLVSQHFCQVLQIFYQVLLIFLPCLTNILPSFTNNFTKLPNIFTKFYKYFTKFYMYFHHFLLIFYIFLHLFTTLHILQLLSIFLIFSASISVRRTKETVSTRYRFNNITSK